MGSRQWRVHGAWRVGEMGGYVGSGEFRVENGECMESGEWRMENWKCVVQCACCVESK